MGSEMCIRDSTYIDSTIKICEGAVGSAAACLGRRGEGVEGVEGDAGGEGGARGVEVAGHAIDRPQMMRRLIGRVGDGGS